MKNVIALPGNDIPSDEPNNSLIESLRALLTKAESGQLQSFIGTGFQIDGCRVSLWVDHNSNVYESLGSLYWLQAEYIHRHTE